TSLFWLALPAFFPFPKTSCAAPVLGVPSFQSAFGVSGGVRLRVGGSCMRPYVSAGNLLLYESNRTPPLTVRRLTVHLSCAYAPSSRSMFQPSWYGVAKRVIRLGLPLFRRYVMFWLSQYNLASMSPLPLLKPTL